MEYETETASWKGTIFNPSNLDLENTFEEESPPKSIYM